MGRLLWIIPFSTHIAYALGTFGHLPAVIGQTYDDPGVSLKAFYIFWFALMGLANVLFLVLYQRMPRLGDRLLQVPGQEYWLSTPETKSELIRRLRGVIEASMLGLNLFFLTVYQLIYQSNTFRPVVAFPVPVLMGGFAPLSLLLVVVVMILTLRNLAAGARSKGCPIEK